jgi:hypothetical protein
MQVKLALALMLCGGVQRVDEGGTKVSNVAAAAAAAAADNCDRYNDNRLRSKSYAMGA